MCVCVCKRKLSVKKQTYLADAYSNVFRYKRDVFGYTKGGRTQASKQLNRTSQFKAVFIPHGNSRMRSGYVVQTQGS